MKQNYEWRECVRCEYIEDCPHPTVSQDGKPIPPRECYQRDKVILIKRNVQTDIL
jgi:hypothetical protein